MAMTMSLPMPARRSSISLLLTSVKWWPFSNKILGQENSGPKPLFSPHAKFGAHFMVQYNLWNCQRQRTYYNFRKRGGKALCFKSQKFSKGIGRQRTKNSKSIVQVADSAHIVWWEERMQWCKKHSTKELVKRLVYSNLLGLNEKLKNGSIKDGSLNLELLEIKWKFPREVLLCRVGEFYEAVGFDACILVEYAGLNPMGGTRCDTVPKAGCPVMNLRQTLDKLTQNGFSVCVVEEVQGPNLARTRKERFVSGHAHPGSPYVYGLAGDDIDVEFPEPVPVVGISRSACGYCFISVLEAMQTYSAEDGLTEEAIVAKLRARPCHSVFLHSSLRKNLSGTTRWGAFGEGGLLWGECYGKHCEWFDGDPISQLLSKVRESYGLDPEQSFRNVTVPSEKKPRPLYLGTAAHLGVIPTEGIPSLLKVLLPPDAVNLCAMYLRDLLLNPPPYQISSSIQSACRLMNNVTCAIPDFTCVPAPKLVKLIGAKEANHMEFLRIWNMTKDILYMHEKHELSVIIEKLLDPTWMATGLKFDTETLVNECIEIAYAIGDIIVLEGEPDQAVTCSQFIPAEFFMDMESSWKGRVKRVHAEDIFLEVDEAAKALCLAVSEDFLPIVLRVRAVSSLPGGVPKGAISYAKEHGAIWFKGKRFTPAVWANTPGEEQIKNLVPSIDAKGKKVGVEWHTTEKVEEALNRYHEAVVQAKLKITDTLRGLAAQLQLKLNTIIFLSVLSVITKTLFSHVSEGRKRNWAFPTLIETNQNSSKMQARKSGKMGIQLEIVGLVPYWINILQEQAIQNTVQMQSLFLLTGPNGGGKSSILRSIGATALLGICGLMVPAQIATIPNFDSILLHMGSYDSPADRKSSFQMEMSEMRSILCEATNRSLVLIDEICRGTEIQKGTCIAASMIEELDSIGCIGIISTHLHGLLDVPLNVRYLLYKAMGTETINGQTKPTWKLIDGSCRESLAFETARCEGIPENIIKRAEQLYSSLKQDKTRRRVNKSRSLINGTSCSETISYIGNDDQASCKQTTVEEKIDNFPTSNFSQTERSITTVAVSDTEGSDHKALLLSNGGNSRPEVDITSFVESSVSTAVGSMTSPDINSANSKSSLFLVEESSRSRSERNLRLLNDAKKAFISTCEERMLERHGKISFLPKSQSLSCSLIRAREQPPPTLTNSSCVYILQRPDGRFYVGETDDLAGRISAHRSVEGMQSVPFLYMRVPGKSIARELETVLINKLRQLGFELVNKADHSHQNFGTYYLTPEFPPF